MNPRNRNIIIGIIVVVIVAIAAFIGFGSVQYILPIMTIAYVLNGNSSIYAQEVLNLEV